MISSVQELKH